MAQGKSLERSEVITMRVTPEEKKRVKAAAKHAGLTVTGYLLGYTIGDRLGQVILDGFDKPTPRRQTQKG